MEFKETASGKLPLGSAALLSLVSRSAHCSQQVCSLQSAGLLSILRKQLVCALAYQLFLHFLVRLVVKYHTFKDDLLWFYTFLRTFFVVCTSLKKVVT